MDEPERGDRLAMKGCCDVDDLLRIGVDPFDEMCRKCDHPARPGLENELGEIDDAFDDAIDELGADGVEFELF